MEAKQKRCANCKLFYEKEDQTCRFHPGSYKTRPGHGTHNPEWSCCVISEAFRPLSVKFSKLSDHFHGCCISPSHVEDVNYTSRLDEFADAKEISSAPGLNVSDQVPAASSALLEIPLFPRRAKLLAPSSAHVCAHCNEEFNFLKRKRNCTWCGRVFCPRCCFASRPMEIVGIEWGLVCKGCLPVVNLEAYLYQNRKWTQIDRPCTRNFFQWLNYMQAINWRAVVGVFKYNGGLLDTRQLSYTSPFSDSSSPVYMDPALFQPAPSPTAPPKEFKEYKEAKEAKETPGGKSSSSEEEEEKKLADKVKASEIPNVVVKDGVALVPHNVQTNETLVGLSLKYGVSIKQIQAANRLPDHNIITRKQLFIPLDPDQLINPLMGIGATSRRAQVMALRKRIHGTYEEADFYLSEAEENVELAFQNWQEDKQWEDENKDKRSLKEEENEPTLRKNEKKARK